MFSRFLQDMSKFCSNCGSALNAAARFCHACGAAAGTSAAPAAATTSRQGASFWVPIIVVMIAVTAFITVKLTSKGESQTGPTGGGSVQPRGPDLSTMSPEDQASRLFDRVMRLAEEGKADSAAFFAPMAFGAIEAAGPPDSHRRYDMGMVALMTGNVEMAAAKADTILKDRPTHLLGLTLAARVADTRRQNSEAAALRKRLLAAEASERAANLPEYSLHGNDVQAAIRLAKGQ